MIKNYFKIAFRALWRSKVHSSINIIGLSLAIACCILIVLFVKDELTFDRFHSKAKDIYRVYALEDWGENQQFFDTSTPFPMGPALKDNLEEVEGMVRINNIGPQIKIANDLYTETVTIVGTDFFKVFDFEVIKGDKETALNGQSHVLITEETAKKFFGNTDPINKSMSIQIGERFEEFNVKAVVKNAPINSSIQFSILISDLNYPRLYNERVLTSAWFNITPETYVLLKEGTDPKALESKFPSIFKPLVGEPDYTKSKYFVGLQPMTSIHLDTKFPAALAPVSDPRYSYILSGIALLILIVACINFVTLSVGRSMKRAKEVGIRKVVGAMRKQLIFQFVGEAVIITMFALALGIILATLNLPLFNDLSGKQLSLSPDGFAGLVLLSLIVIIGLFAGSYPALVLSGFQPVAILKGTFQPGNNKQRLRKILVGVQLVLSIFLISSTLLMKQQLDFLRDKNLGFDKEQLAVVQLNVNGGRIRERIPKGFEQAEQFKIELAKIPQIASVCGSSHDFGQGAWMDLGYTDDNGTYRTFKFNTVDDDFIPTMKIELAAGRNFSQDQPADQRRSIIVNEAFVKSYGWSDAVGKRIPGKNFQEHEIIGVVKDFNFASLYTKVEPLVLAMDPMIAFSGAENFNTNNSPIPKLLIRLHPGNASGTIDQVQSVWDKLTGGEEFTFSFVDQSINAQYRNDENLGKIVSIATLLAIVIGSLGLYGLASLAMQNRTKEISIRKVLGATERSLLILLSKDYVFLILLSLVISVPLTWYFMNDWLASFEYRVPIGADVFLMAGGISLIIALFTISYQAIKTAWSQPADTLKYE
jgi:putative ABC transport system permease protein